MRDSLTLVEIDDIAEGFPEEFYVQFMDIAREAAKTCICNAHGVNECCCGAWDGSD
jgi:hypothetical protein